MKQWIEDAYWAWRNSWHFRFDSYENDIDRLAFFEELSIGHIQMTDEYLMSQPGFDPYNLSGRDPYYSYVMRQKQ